MRHARRGLATATQGEGGDEVSGSKTVWKYPLSVDDEQFIEMPANAHILCVQTQRGRPCLWALVDPTNQPETRKILIAGTGHVREELWGLVNYIGTFQLDYGQLVFHVFESVIYGEIAPSETVMARLLDQSSERIRAGHG
jgi:hypothetical protein